MIEDYRSLYSKQGKENNLFCIDEYGFISTKDSFMMPSERSSKMEWYEVIDYYEDDIKKFKDVVLKKRLLQKGIPLSLKSRLWMYLLGSSAYKSTGGSKLLILSNIILPTDQNKKLQARMKYLNLIEQKSKYEYQIHVDIQRTFRNHFLFHDAFGKGQSELFNILIAFSNNFKNIGYCQGISEIAAFLLMYFPEDQAFTMICNLIKKNKLERLFDKNLTKIPSLMKLQRVLFYTVIPDTIPYLEKNCETYTIYFIEWYITLFTRFNIKLALRIWDFLMFYGFNILLYFAASILKYFHSKILSIQDESLIRFLNNIEKEEIDETIIVDYVAKFLEESKYQYVDHKCSSI